MKQRSARIGEVLVASLRADAWCHGSPELRQLATGHPLPGLADAAAFHGIAGYVHHALRHVSGVPPRVVVDLEDAYRVGLAGHLGALGGLRTVAAVLDAAAVPWLVIKGPVLATAVHPRPDLRGYGDLDVVVPARTFQRALESLEAAGGTVAAPNWALRRRITAGEVPVTLPDGGVVDLHWHVLNHARLREPFRIPMRDLFDRAEPVTVDGRPVLTLEPTDTLLYLALHASMAGGNRLVWLKDLERSLAQRPPDPEALVRRADAWHVALPVATTLAKARAVLRADVPETMLRALAPGRVWERIAELAWRASPPARARPGRSVDRIVSRAARRDAPSSLLELARRVLFVATGPLRTGRGGASSPSRHVDEPERAAFLDTVVSGPDAYSL
ncbi:MAG TPA: nucleotidyltransferase family protein [Nitriliruptorales bacterium]|nr:nucleotidyltransferase family protein [Nitriliruptorales bacterium]